VLEKRVFPLAKSIDCDFVEKCDVTDDDAIDDLFDAVRDRFGRVDILVHAVAFAERDDLGGRFVDISRDGFKLAMDISAYSLIALSRRAAPLMPAGGSIMAMTYYAAEKVMPAYNVMAIAKAALETITRYLAYDLGRQGVRVNAISAGPIKTLSAAGVPGLRTFLKYAKAASPLMEQVSQEDVGKTALYLASDLSTMVTGEIIHVDAGYNTLGLTIDRDEFEQG
jgi:enoyl-[acyl-carrier protein] reductase I